MTTGDIIRLFAGTLYFCTAIIWSLKIGRYYQLNKQTMSLFKCLNELRMGVLFIILGVAGTITSTVKFVFEDSDFQESVGTSVRVVFALIVFLTSIIKKPKM